MRYRLSKFIPVRFRSTYGVQIEEQDIARGGEGNHFRSETHQDAEHVSWWQFRDRVFHRRTVRICLP